VNPAIQRRLTRAVRALLGHITVDQFILDVGSGNGRLYRSLALPNTRTVGIDLAFNMCRLGRENGMDCVQGDALALPFCSDTFDVVISIEMVQCVDDLGSLLSELTRVTKPGGRIVLSTVNRWSWVMFIARAARAVLPRADGTAIVPRGREQLLEAAIKASLVIAARIGWHTLLLFIGSRTRSS
jgi:ubiquinone/menaquinone biosynthesis C-methylase UbiE